MPKTATATRHQIAEGLRILLRAGGLEGAGCDYQRLYAGGPPPENLEPADLRKLNEFGWHWERLHLCWVIYVGSKEGMSHG